MKNKKPIIVLALIGTVLLFLSSVISIYSDDGGTKHKFVSIHGQEIEIYGGDGPYRFDSVNKAVMFRGFDIVNIVIVIPIFIIGLCLFIRYKIVGSVILLACNVYLTYNYLIGVMGNSFNGMFLIWTALFSVGIWGTVLITGLLSKTDAVSLFDDKFPRKIMIIYMFILAAFLFFSYLFEVIGSYVNKISPVNLQHYTTLELAALELGIMVPLHVIAAILIIKRNQNGFLLSLVLSFAALMTFLALTAYSLLNYFQYGNGTVIDICRPMILSILSGFCTILGLRHTSTKLVLDD